MTRHYADGGMLTTGQTATTGWQGFWGRRRRGIITHQNPSAEKEKSHKAVAVIAGMKCTDTHRLSSGKIIAQSRLLRRHGWKVQEEMGGSF